MKPGAISKNVDIWSLASGTVVRVSCGLYDHVALLGDQIISGERSVMCFSAEAGGFVAQRFSEFASGRKITIDGYPGSLPPAIVMQRARMKMGHPYSLANFNCEHFVRYAHGVPEESPQMAKWTMFAILGAFVLVAARA